MLRPKGLAQSSHGTQSPRHGVQSLHEGSRIQGFDTISWLADARPINFFRPGHFHLSPSPFEKSLSIAPGSTVSHVSVSFEEIVNEFGRLRNVLLRGFPCEYIYLYAGNTRSNIEDRSRRVRKVRHKASEKVDRFHGDDVLLCAVKDFAGFSIISEPFERYDRFRDVPGQPFGCRPVAAAEPGRCIHIETRMLPGENELDEGVSGPSDSSS